MAIQAIRKDGKIIIKGGIRGPYIFLFPLFFLVIGLVILRGFPVIAAVVFTLMILGVAWLLPYYYYLEIDKLKETLSFWSIPGLGIKRFPLKYISSILVEDNGEYMGSLYLLLNGNKRKIKVFSTEIKEILRAGKALSDAIGVTFVDSCHSILN